jgi:hypothetical protein
MGHQVTDAVGVAIDLEIEPPVVINACLPTVLSFVELLGMQRRVVQVPDQKVDLLDEGLLCRQGAAANASMARCERWTFIEIF